MCFLQVHRALVLGESQREHVALLLQPPRVLYDFFVVCVLLLMMCCLYCYVFVVLVELCFFMFACLQQPRVRDVGHDRVEAGEHLLPMKSEPPIPTRTKDNQFRKNVKICRISLERPVY